MKSHQISFIHLYWHSKADPKWECTCHSSHSEADAVSRSPKHVTPVNTVRVSCRLISVSLIIIKNAIGVFNRQ